MKAEQIVVRTTSEDFQEQLSAALKSIGKKGFDVVLDAILGGFFQPGYRAMNAGGRYIVYGAASMTPHKDSLGIRGWLKLGYQWLTRPKVDPLNLPSDNKSVMGFNLIHCLNDAENLIQLLEEVEAMGLPPPLVGSVYEFKDIVSALRTFQSGKTVGKVVIQTS
eukprot:CAMPEP_0204889074 /NCGR_PEP_ID=MMETSP1349-20130617/21930_1 /ASSEMBLY_ACC=CAM_ASM_000710 /TAXON_ID=215587 /ORGANISM="Aplanochytrium stocchinoi, Strain GSBS06" /LENGTH=163 /DNA_ID=CAMNT_0052052957 /DNA_START=23 /DNA_END=514 /DNA_ORIENTATION=+